MKNKMFTAALVLVAASAFGLGVLAESGGVTKDTRAVPLRIPYHGILEKDGVLVQAIDSETVSFRVSLWDAPAAGNKVWPEGEGIYEEHGVNVYDGRFAFDIGSDVPYQHVPGTPLYLDIQVRGQDDAEYVRLGGRQRFLSAPYAVAAQRSDTDFLVDGNLTVEGDGTLQADLDVAGRTTTSSLDVSGAATVGSLTLDLENDTMTKLSSAEYNCYDDWDSCPAGHTGDFSRCLRMTGTGSSVCALSADHGGIICEIFTSGGSWWLGTDGLAHDRQCRAVCLSWN